MRILSLPAGLTGLLLVAGAASAAPLSFFNAQDFASANGVRANWLSNIGITAPQHRVDFETGYTNGQDVQNAVFAGGLTMRYANGTNTLQVTNVAGAIGGSNPVDAFAVRIADDDPVFELELDFSASPVDYFAARDIDQFGSSIKVLLEDGTMQVFSIETTAASGDSAEFFGFGVATGPRIQRIHIDASSAGDGPWGLDNMEYGRIPEPGTLLLAGMALASLATARRRTRSRCALSPRA